MGRPRLTMLHKKNNILTRHLSSICGLSTASSKKDITSLDFIFHSTKKSNKSYSHQNSLNKKIKGINDKEYCLEEIKELEKKKHNTHENNYHSFHRSRTALGQINDISNRMIIEEEKKPNNHKPFFRRIYSHEFMEFENERTKKLHYVKKYKEDDIPFTKSKILPEIQWQDLDNDVETDEEQKKGAIRKEINWIGEAIKQMQSNDKYFKHNVTMYKLSQKYPNEE